MSPDFDTYAQLSLIITEIYENWILFNKTIFKDKRYKLLLFILKSISFIVGQKIYDEYPLLDNAFSNDDIKKVEVLKSNRLQCQRAIIWKIFQRKIIGYFGFIIQVHL